MGLAGFVVLLPRGLRIKVMINRPSKRQRTPTARRGWGRPLAQPPDALCPPPRQFLFSELILEKQWQTRSMLTIASYSGRENCPSKSDPLQESHGTQRKAGLCTLPRKTAETRRQEPGRTRGGGVRSRAPPPSAPLTPQGRVGVSAEPPRRRGLGFVSGQKGQGERRFPGCREDEASEGAASAGPARGGVRAGGAPRPLHRVPP